MRNIPHKITGDDLTADEFNDIPEEEENLITSTGQALTAGDLYQIAKAVSMYVAVGDFYVDSGSGNNYVLSAVSPLQAPHQYMDGFRCRFRISHTNTGSSTINVNGLGSKLILKEDGVSQLGAGDLPAGEHGEVVFHADVDAFELYSHKYQDNTFVTGDPILTDADGERAGWILVNDSAKVTIGDASSSATLRANADCEALFKLYWRKDNADCPVIGGRGATASADWLAHKQITIPDSLRKVFAAYDLRDTVRTAQVEGAKTHVITVSQLAWHGHNFSESENHYNNNFKVSGGGDAFVAANNGFDANAGSIGRTGSNEAFSIMQPTIYKNLYIKL